MNLNLLPARYKPAFQPRILSKFSTGLCILGLLIAAQTMAAAPACESLYTPRIGFTGGNMKYDRPTEDNFMQDKKDDSGLDDLQDVLAEKAYFPYPEVAVEIYGLLNNKAAWIEYTKNLQDATRLEMLASQNPTQSKLAENQGLNRNMMLKVLIKRARARGEISFQTLKDSDLNKFFQAVGSGPFFDKHFGGKQSHDKHGQDSHLIQRDFVSGLLAKRLKKKAPDFYTALSMYEKIWDNLFDSFNKNPSNPEYLRPALEDFLPNK